MIFFYLNTTRLDCIYRYILSINFCHHLFKLLSFYREFNRAERKKQELRAAGEMSDSEEDEEIDEGFKIPGRIWSKLFKYG